MISYAKLKSSLHNSTIQGMLQLVDESQFDQRILSLLQQQVEALFEVPVTIKYRNQILGETAQIADTPLLGVDAISINLHLEDDLAIEAGVMLKKHAAGIYRSLSKKHENKINIVHSHTADRLRDMPVVAIEKRTLIDEKSELDLSFFIFKNDQESQRYFSKVRGEMMAEAMKKYQKPPVDPDKRVNLPKVEFKKSDRLVFRF
ncbi:hypothetical protein Q9L42_020845 (plasmid) [Methylomarinum sp. Ch1-1]|uniref:Uncharacterized protein n=1 Tax=Methylomarinum roseum TaxID=3067653 RepID=A0AAU7P0N5_9GAMM|nr:hypothetical protein [Methylomarinum sp. Ch1-1]MDP4518969.1 hypothetical protein [Methylomarinum sp. Ch1-1]MDP4523367.1 hypothetical protein [Methylomarinum sp. Ch1-1]